MTISFFLRHPPSWTACLAAAVLAITVPASLASAQSTRELREENEQLRAQLSDTQKDLDAAKQRIASLEQLVQQLKAAIPATPPPSAAPPQSQPQPAAAPPPRVTVDESMPLAGPRALFNAVIRSYDGATADSTIGRAGKPERAAYLRLLEKWAGATKREFNGPIVWTVRIIDPDRDLSAGREVEVIAVDPETGAALGDSFMVALDRTQAERLWRIYDRRIEERETLGPLELRGNAEALININPAREFRGPFDNPIFIGPFAEYSFRVTAKSLMPKGEKPAPTQSGNSVKPPAPAAPASK